MVTRRVRNLNQVIQSPPDSPEAIVVPDSLDVQTPVECQGGDSCGRQDQDGASATGKGEQSGASLSGKVEQGKASSSEKQGHVGASMSGKEVQGPQEINRYVPQVPDGAETTTSSPPELFNINNRVISESKNGLRGKEGQSGSSSSGPQRRSGGASLTGVQQNQVTGAFTSGKKIQGQQEIISPLFEIAYRTAVSSSPRLNAFYRAQTSNETRIKKINYPTGIWSLENGQAMGFFNVTRSDDKKVQVDNHFLREKYPQLLIDFYEQHIVQTNGQQNETEPGGTEETTSKPSAK